MQEEIKNKQYAEEFIKNTKNFYEENYNLIDDKHNKIIKNSSVNIYDSKTLKFKILKISFVLSL